MLGSLELGVKLPPPSRLVVAGVAAVPVPGACVVEVPLPNGPGGMPALPTKEGGPVPAGADGVVGVDVVVGGMGAPGTVVGMQTTFGGGPAVTVTVAGSTGAVTVTVLVRKGMLTRKPAAADEVEEPPSVGGVGFGGEGTTPVTPIVPSGVQLLPVQLALFCGKMPEKTPTCRVEKGDADGVGVDAGFCCAYGRARAWTALRKSASKALIEPEAYIVAKKHT